ncbi:MAG: hypothetical protein K1X54_11740 [Flavobacteriales bacterium]|nr:hypothetical protein [Flavobacteriales bacterium]
MDRFIFYIHVLEGIAKNAIDKVARCVQHDMITFQDEFLNTDNGLNNVWEEYCAQLQGENSNFLENYQDIIDMKIKDHSKTLDPSEKMAIVCSSILKVSAIKNWENQIDSALRYEDVKADDSVVFLELVSAVKNLAYEYESRNLRRFLGNSDEEDE